MKTKHCENVQWNQSPAVWFSTAAPALTRRSLVYFCSAAYTGRRWKESGYVFTTTIGTPIERRNLLREWYKITKTSNLPKIRFHDLRHTAATLLFAQGVHPKTVMEILGHSDLNTTMRIYGHVLDQMKREAASKMDEIFGVATNSATGPIQPTRPN